MQWLGFIACLEAAFPTPGLPAVAKQCAASADMSWDVLMTCTEGPEGIAIQTDNEKRTPTHQYVPWVVINGTPFQQTDDDDGKACYQW